MSLSCYCGDDYDWYYTPADDYQKLDTKRSRKCVSCRDRIAVGATALRFECFGIAEPMSIKERIYGDGNEYPMPDKWMCERCADLYFSLYELGFCINLGIDDMRDLVKEYAEVYGPKNRRVA